VLGLLIAVPVTAVIKDLLDNEIFISSDTNNTTEDKQALETPSINSYPQP
jgi:predicted PurR-regulated permease PerM